MTRPNALLSLSDRQGLDRLAAALVAHGFALTATSGTAGAVRAMGLPCSDAGELTGFPPLCDGRVKTLHPKIFAGILARRDVARDMEDLRRYEIRAFDVVAVNLYPFEAASRREDAALVDVIEEIDIGGVSLLRAAAKNFTDVTVLCDPRQYEAFIASLPSGPGVAARKALAAAAFERCEAYDDAIAAYLAGGGADADPPATMRLSLPLRLPLRYGENPWARAAFYLGDEAPYPEQLSGKTLSYNNLLDVDSCLRLLSPVEEPRGFPADARSPRTIRAAIVKHTVPCGYAAGDSTAETLAAALGADPISAFGGIVACNGPVDASAAHLLAERFLEVVAAPHFDDDACTVLFAKKNLRVLRYDASLPERLLSVPKVRSALGGVLLEHPDANAPDDEWRVVAGPEPTLPQWRDLLFGLGAVRQVKSNAAVVIKGETLHGVCGGQTNRVAAVELACKRAGDNVRGAVLATDGFFPFADGVEAAAAAGIAAVVAPSGSIRDREVIAAASKAGLSLVFSARRYFLH